MKNIITIIKHKIAGVMTLGIISGLLLSCPSPIFAAKKTETRPFTVVVDAGHGGHDTGAVDNGVKEKDINLAVAKKLSDKIQKGLKGSKVVMTRSGDSFVSLQERANIANRNRGDLFVSIHTNSLDKKSSSRKTVKGATVYALGLHKDAANQQVARRENSVIELESGFQQKYSGFDPSKDESYIIFEMAQKKNLGQSLKFANSAQKELVATANRADRGVKQAGFWVLWATSMPSVLVELDFICNPESAKYMASEAGQEKLASSLYNAVKEYISHSESVRSTVIDMPKSSDPQKNKNKKESKKKGKKKNEVSEPVQQSVAESPADDVPVLAKVEATHKTKATVAQPKQNGRSINYADAQKGQARVGQRKRRSAASKLASDKRTLDTKTIQLTYENKYLAKVEVKAPAVDTQTTVAEDKNSSKKNKDKKKTKDKNNNKNNKSKIQSQDNNKAMAKDSKTKGNQKRIVVSSSGGTNVKRHTSLAGKRNIKTAE